MSILNDVRQEIRELPFVPRNVRIFGMVLGILLAFIGWKFHTSQPTISAGALLLGAASIVSAAMLWKTSFIVYRASMAVAAVIGWFLSRILLTAFFFLVITPIGLVMRLLGKDLLDRKIDRTAASYWMPVETDPNDRERYLRKF